MSDWSRGYAVDIPFPVVWRGFIAPLELAAVAALMGVQWAPPADGAIAELGCARGFTANVLAAGMPRRAVHGFDYNPAHIAEARGLAGAAGLGNAQFHETDLATISDAELDRLPEFDLIALHGVWSWVDDAVRAGIIRLIGRRLKPGGMVYVGYNAQPGCAAETALQRLLREAASLTGGDPGERVQAALALVRRLAATRPAHLHPTEMLQMTTHERAVTDPGYLAHEFLTAHWRPEFFADLAAQLAGVKCDFVGSLNLWENLPEFVFTPAQRAAQEALPSLAARELVKDICLTRSFRRDLFVRGVRPTPREAALDRLMLALQHPPPQRLPVLAVQHGAAELPAADGAALLAALVDGPQPIGRLRTLLPGARSTAAELAVMLLGTGLCVPFDPAAPDSPAAVRLNRLTARLYADATRPHLPLALASSCAGGGLSCAGLELAVVGTLLADARDASPAALACRLDPDLEGEAASRFAGTLAALLAERLPVWQRFGIL